MRNKIIKWLGGYTKDEFNFLKEFRQIETDCHAKILRVAEDEIERLRQEMDKKVKRLTIAQIPEKSHIAQGYQSTEMVIELAKLLKEFIVTEQIGEYVRFFVDVVDRRRYFDDSK